jgi:hypothetical protein
MYIEPICGRHRAKGFTLIISFILIIEREREKEREREREREKVAPVWNWISKSGKQ